MTQQRGLGSCETAPMVDQEHDLFAVNTLVEYLFLGTNLSSSHLCFYYCSTEEGKVLGKQSMEMEIHMCANKGTMESTKVMLPPF